MLPAIIISKEQLFAAVDRNSLLTGLLKATPHKTMTPFVYLIDSAGDEFCFMPSHRILAPGFFPRKWSKKAVIGLFNHSTNAGRLGSKCEYGGLSNKKVKDVVSLVASLIEKSQKSIG